MPGKQSRKTAWGDLGGIYQVVHFVHRWRLYRGFKHVPDACIVAMAHLLAKVFFKTTGKLGRRMHEAIPLLAGRAYPERFVARLIKASFMNMALLLLDIMLKAPNYETRDLDRIIRWDGIEHLDAALAGGKGAIIPSIHVGDFFHCVGALALHPRGYQVAVVANMKNQLIFDMLVRLPRFSRMHVVGREAYGKVRETIVAHLQRNRVVILMHDIAKGSNLRVPFTPARRDLLVPVPQGAVFFHLETGAPVLPLVAIPRGRFTRSTLRFVEPTPVEAACATARDLSGKAARGTIAAAINACLFPYISRYVHCFEEVSTFASRVLDDTLRFPAGTTLDGVATAMRSWLDGLVDRSFEPGRDDDGMKAWIHETFTTPGPRLFQLSRQGRVSLGGLSPWVQVKKCTMVLATLAARAGDLALARDLRTRLALFDGFAGTGQ